MISPVQTIRSGLRHVAIDALTLRDRVTGAAARATVRPRVHFLYFHDVESGHLEKFRALLAWCAAHGTFASYADAAARLTGGDIDRPIYNLSFDDGFLNCVAASRVMDEFGARGCFFVNAAFVGADAEAGGAFCRDRIRWRATPFMSWADCEDLIARGHEIGNHTLRHTDLGAPDLPLAEEIGQGREEIVRRLGRCEHFAWPFGRFENFSAAARREVFASGHATCASAVRGAHVARSAPLADVCIRREHLDMQWPIEHLKYFVARSAARAGEADNRWPAELAS